MSNLGNSIADEWKALTSYDSSALVMHDSQLWKCINAHTSGSTWDSSNWVEGNVVGDLVSVTQNTQTGHADIYAGSTVIGSAASIKDIDEVKNEKDFQYYKKLDITSGELQDSTIECVTPFIDVSQNRRVGVYLGGNSNYYCGYDANKTFVDYYSCGASETGRHLPTTVFYIRLTCRMTDVENAYVKNLNTNGMQWESFISWSKSLKQISDKVNAYESSIAAISFSVYRLVESGEYLYHRFINVADINIEPYYVISPYIDVSENRNISVFPNGNRTMYMHGYDANKNYLDYWSIASGATMTRILPSTIYYIRICYDIRRQDDVFVKNSTTDIVFWTPYPYWQGALESGDVISLHSPKNIYSLLANLKYNINPMTTRAYGDSNLNLLFFSDLHSCATPLKRIVEFANEYNYSDYIDAIIAGGDNVNRAVDDYSFWSNSGANKILPVVGNHELLLPEDKISAGTYTTPQIDGVNVSANSMPYSAKFVYDREFAPFLSSTNFTSIVTNKCYWYKDFASAKIRVIGIDDYHWKESAIKLVDNTYASKYPDNELLDTGEQLTWFTNTLASAKTAGFSVIVVHHAPARFNSPLQCSFTSLDFQNNVATDASDTSGAAYTREPFVAVQNFIDGGGKFICWLTGHLHQDAVGVVKGFTDQFQMTIDTTRYGYDVEGRSLDDGFGHNAHIVDTNSADCMDIVSVDTYHKQISLVRIGSNYDRRGRHIGAFVWDYENKTMISCD